MRKFECIVGDPLGIHARTAASLASEARKYASKIVMEADGESVEVADLIGVMGLGVVYGQSITLEFEGADEDAAFEGIRGILTEL